MEITATLNIISKYFHWGLSTGFWTKSVEFSFISCITPFFFTHLAWQRLNKKQPQPAGLKGSLETSGAD